MTGTWKPETTKIFLSYRRQDAGHLAGRLYGQLADHFGRQDVFMDVDSLSPGTNFFRAINWAIDASNVVLALIGPTSLTAQGCQRRPQARRSEGSRAD